ncbi:putative ankyrin repeat protein RBE_0220 [Haliotis cracherodii]|uniref:putative ankyrin repeat protein RBE_0220 n=1 Tax=Haliotis cracherodii TaxID=6455 RepID=UPI0039E92989
MTPAMLAAHGGHKEVFDQLVRKGANLSLLGHSDRNILYFACKGRNLEIVKYVLTQNVVDVNNRNVDGLTPVMNAAIWGDKGLFDFLVEEGANLSLLSYDEENIFYLACERDNVEIIKYLLPQYIKFINSFVDGMTPVLSAACDKRKEVFDLLVKEGANLSLLDDANSNILHLAC